MLTEHTWTAALHGIYAGTYNSWRTKSDIVKCLQIAFSQNKAVLLVGPPPKNTPRLCSRTTCTGKPGLTQIKSNSFSRQLIAEGSNQLLIKTRQTKIGLSSWEPQHFSKLLMHPSTEFLLTCGQVFQSSSVILECKSDWKLFGKCPLTSMYQRKETETGTN